MNIDPLTYNEVALLRKHFVMLNGSPEALEILLDPAVTLASFAAWFGTAGKSALFDQLIISPTGISSIAASPTAMSAVASTAPAMAAIVGNTTAMNAIAASANAMTVMVSNATAMSAIAGHVIAVSSILKSPVSVSLVSGSPVAMNAFANSTVAMPLVFESTASTASVFNTWVGRSAIWGSVYASTLAMQSPTLDWLLENITTTASITTVAYTQLSNKKCLLLQMFAGGSNNGLTVTAGYGPSGETYPTTQSFATYANILKRLSTLSVKTSSASQAGSVKYVVMEA